jgi:hypothetical protein
MFGAPVPVGVGRDRRGHLVNRELVCRGRPARRERRRRTLGDDQTEQGAADRPDRLRLACTSTGISAAIALR